MKRAIFLSIALGLSLNSLASNLDPIVDASKLPTQTESGQDSTRRQSPRADAFVSKTPEQVQREMDQFNAATRGVR